MPTFDVVSEVDSNEVMNAVNQANRELETRFDFKGSKSSYKLEGEAITMKAPDEFKLTQMVDILTGRLSKRNVDVRCLKLNPPSVNVAEASQTLDVRQGIDTDTARKMVKMIKGTKLKVQASIQGEKVRINGKKRDDLQEVIAFLKDADMSIPLQFDNFRD